MALVLNGPTKGSTMTGKIPPQAFESKVLDPVFHERLLADLKNVSRTAGIPQHFIWSRMSDYCNGPDYEWVKTMRRATKYGMCYVGLQDKPIEDKMMAITGACLRNYVDARVMSLQDVLVRLKEDVMPEPTVLLIPNFCMQKEAGAKSPGWQSDVLMGLLLTRLSHEKKTILYAESMDAVESFYGGAFRMHIENQYLLVG